MVHERRRLQGELGALRAVHADALSDAGPAAAGDRWPVSVAIEELSVLALSWPQHRAAPDATAAQAFLRHLDALGVAVAGGAEPGPGPAAAARASPYLGGGRASRDRDPDREPVLTTCPAHRAGPVRGSGAALLH